MTQARVLGPARWVWRRPHGHPRAPAGAQHARCVHAGSLDGALECKVEGPADAARPASPRLLPSASVCTPVWACAWPLRGPVLDSRPGGWATVSAPLTGPMKGRKGTPEASLP